MRRKISFATFDFPLLRDGERGMACRAARFFIPHAAMRWDGAGISYTLRRITGIADQRQHRYDAHR